MRIKWNSNFQIPESTVQFAETFIRVVKFENVDSKCNVEYIMTDESEQNLAKYVRVQINRTFANEAEVYNYLLAEFEGSEII